MRQHILLIILGAIFIKPALANTTVIPEVNTRATHATATSKQDTKVQTTHITREQIAKSPMVTLSELLKREQSIIRLSNNSGDSSQVAMSIRGFGDNAAANSLILVDGFPLTNPSLLAPNFNAIALLDIERVDIIQGSEGTLWGDQAVGGVVNIITRHPEKWLFDTQIGIGSYRKQFYNGLVGNRFNNGVFFKAFGFSNQTDNYRAHNHQNDATLSAQLGLDYARGTISLNVQSFRNTVQFPGGLTQAQYNANPRQAIYHNVFANYQTNQYWLLNKQILNDQWLIETHAAYREITGEGFLFAPFNRNDWTASIEPRLIGHWNEQKLLFGYLGQHSGYQLTSTLVHQHAHAQQNNLFAQWVIPFSHQWDFTLGARKAWQDNNVSKNAGQPIHSSNQVFVTEQGLAFHPNNTWQFFVRRDGNFRFPKVNEETWVPVGTTSLQVQTGVSYETGATWTTARQKTQLSLYRLALQNEIAFDPVQTPARPFGSFRNFDTTLRRGVTLTEQFHVTSTVTFNSQLNYVDARFSSGPFYGKQIPAVPAWNGNIGLSYEFLPHWQTQYYALYTGKRFASEDDANVGQSLPSYWLHAIALQYERQHFNINFEIGNVFNQKYSTYTLFDPTTHTNTYFPGAGRNYLLTFKTNLD